MESGRKRKSLRRNEKTKKADGKKERFPPKEEGGEPGRGGKKSNRGFQLFEGKWGKTKETIS